MDTLLKDIRYGLRGLLNRPAFTIVALVVLALGIGANTAIFTLINAVLLKPLPVTKPEELVLFDDSPGEGTSVSDGDPRAGQWHRFSYSSYRYFREHNGSFQELSAFRSGESRLSVRRSDAQTGEGAERASGHLVSGNYFAVLGVNALLGRVLTNGDDSAAAPPAAVISNGYWTQKLNGDTQVVGKSVLLNGTAFTVVGVMPPEFFGERVRRAPDFWLPLAFQPQIELRTSFLEDKNVYWLNLLGRLKPGTKIEQAQASVNNELRQFISDQVGTQLTDEVRRGIQNSYVQLTPGGRGLSGPRSFYAQALRMLMVIVVLVLLIACANVGNLLLSRAATRQAEISLRQALGASRARLMRQLLTESLLLAVIGGLAGVLLAQWGVSLFAIPNVRSATMASYSPMSGTNTNSSLLVRGYTPPPGENMVVSHLQIGPGYGETLGVPLLFGREIGLQDTAGSTKVAVVNQAFAEGFFPGQNPVGRRITFNEDSDKDDLEIVGVIGDAKYDSAKEKADRTVYQPILQVQDQQTYNNVLELRTAGDPLSFAADVRAAIAQVDDKLPILNLTSLRTQTDDSLRQERLLAQLVSFFGVLGLVLSCVGLYGIMAHAVVRRTNEIGIRMALGAERRDIIWMVLKESLLLVGAGLVIGAPTSWGAAHLISSQLFGLNPSDPVTLSIAVVLLTLVAALAGYIPARKASRVDPLVALRYE